MALFLLGCLLAAYGAHAAFGKSAGRLAVVERGILGGPAASSPSSEGSSESTFAVAESMPEVVVDNAPQEEHTTDASMGMLRAPREALFGGGVFVTYAVKRGDTLSKIGRDFGVSVQTIVGSNPELRGKSLQIGQELLVPPVSGLVYRVRDGETPESVALAFDITAGQLQEFNRGVDFNKFGLGMVLVIPGAHPLPSSVGTQGGGASLVLQGYFILPTAGFNWGKLHEHNAVDIANACGTKVVAAAEGLVIETSNDAWGGGYGHYVLLEHPNGTKTRYAHLEEVGVSIGDYIKQGDGLGTMGQTGEASGCHLHFEVEGARNPFARS